MTTGPASIQVLHVDDDPDLADLVAIRLERENPRLSVRTATNTDDGLDVLVAADVDCVVSDYDMPGTNGIEFLQTVRADYPDLPFILYTGKGSEEVASDAISAGVTDYLQKESTTSQYAVLANRITNAVEQYRSNQALEASRERLSMFFEQSLLGVVEWNEDFEFARVNEAATDILGYDEAELRGESWETIVPDSDRHSVGDIVAELLEGKGGYHSINENVRGDGERITCEWHNRVVTDSSGAVVAIFSQFQDITERRNRQKELERHRAVIQAATNTIITLDESTVVRSVNPAVEDTFGYTPDEVVGEPVTTLMSDDVARRHRAAFDRYLETGEKTLDWEYTELEGQHADGSPVPLSVTFGEVTHEGERLFVGIIRDISERRARQAELRRKERRYQAVFHDPNLLVGLIDVDGTVLDVNQTAREYVDTPVEDIEGEPFWETPWFSHSEALQAEVADWIDRAAAGEYVEFEADLERPSGDQYTIDGVFRPVTDDDGEVVSLLISDRDVMERKERERELRLFRTLLDHSTDGVLVIDPETGRYLDVNETACDRLGYSRAEMLALTVVDVETELPDLAAWQAFVDDLESNPELTFDGVHRRKDGTTYPVEINATYLELDREYVVAIARDVTERRAHQRELESTNAVLSTLLETLPVGVLAEDDDRDVLVANERLLELFDVPGSPDDFEGADCEDVATQVSDAFVDPDEFVARINGLVGGDVPVHGEELALRDGRTFVRSHEPVALSGGGGHLWTYRDVTDWKTYESRLEALNEMAQQLMTADSRADVAAIGVEAARDVLDLDANAIHLASDDRSSLVPVAETDAVADLVGDPPEFTDGNSIAWRAYDRGEALALADIHEDPDIYNPDSPIRSELHLPIGEYGVLIAGSPTPGAFDQEDFVLGKILAGSLTTALDQVERTEQLRSRERELTRQNERLEEFAGIVSHDLRNPLQVAEGRVELAQEECDSEHLGVIRRAHERMNDLIDDILTLAREGNQVNDVESVDLATVARGCWGNVATADATLAVESTCTVEADRSRLQQLLENLMRNAVEHGGPGVTATVGALPDGFYVEDDGRGIPADAREDVFAPGYTSSIGGTGFGLSIVEQLADAHDWDVAVREGSAGGARFEITFTTA